MCPLLSGMIQWKTASAKTRPTRGSTARTPPSRLAFRHGMQRDTQMVTSKYKQLPDRHMENGERVQCNWGLALESFGDNDNCIKPL